jgi:hypothetical protein
MKATALLCLVAVSFLAAVSSSRGAQSPPDPFTYEAPKDWKPERIPFPLGFAPSLPYKGFEQLHFAPGMFDPKSEQYFTYAFFWWIEGEPHVTEATLAHDLTDYYKGLCGAVAGQKGMTLDLSKVSAKIEPAPSGQSGSPYPTERFAGVVNAFDPFKTGLPVVLNVEVSAWRCDREDRTCVFFCVSPKPTNAPEWAPMRTTLASFRCRR